MFRSTEKEPAVHLCTFQNILLKNLQRGIAISEKQVRLGAVRSSRLGGTFNSSLTLGGSYMTGSYLLSSLDLSLK